MRRPLSKSQIVCISLLWLALCYLVLTKAERIDGMTVVMNLLKYMQILSFVLPVAFYKYLFSYF